MARRKMYNSLPASKVSHGKWCDYCSCESCQEGWEIGGKTKAIDPDGNEVEVDLGDFSIKHAPVDDGSNICNVCLYDEPWEGCESPGDGFACEAFKSTGRCDHRPKLAPGATWTKG